MIAVAFKSITNDFGWPDFSSDTSVLTSIPLTPETQDEERPLAFHLHHIKTL